MTSVGFQRSVPVELSILEVPLAFVHIPKTAGTSFIRYLEGHFLKSEIAPPFLGDFNAIQISDPSKKLFWGHFRLVDIARYLPHALFLTFLRHPVLRSYSQYKSWHDPRNFPKDDPWRNVMTTEQIDDIEFAQKVSFEEFVSGRRARFETELRDVQTLMLSSHQPGTPQFLPSAKDNLLSMAFFGIVEEFDLSIRLLQQHILGFKSYDVAPQLENRSDTSPLSLSKKGADRLSDMLQNDMELYRFAIEIFSERIKGTVRCGR